MENGNVRALRQRDSEKTVGHIENAVVEHIVEKQVVAHAPQFGSEFRLAQLARIEGHVPRFQPEGRIPLVFHGESLQFGTLRTPLPRGSVLERQQQFADLFGRPGHVRLQRVGGIVLVSQHPGPFETQVDDVDRQLAVVVLPVHAARGVGLVESPAQVAVRGRSHDRRIVAVREPDGPDALMPLPGRIAGETLPGRPRKPVEQAAVLHVQDELLGRLRDVLPVADAFERNLAVQLLEPHLLPGRAERPAADVAPVDLAERPQLERIQPGRIAPVVDGLHQAEDRRVERHGVVCLSGQLRGFQRDPDDGVASEIRFQVTQHRARNVQQAVGTVERHDDVFESRLRGVQRPDFRNPGLVGADALLNGGHDVGGMDTVEAGRPVRGFGRHQQRISGKKPAGEKEQPTYGEEKRSPYERKGSDHGERLAEFFHKIAKKSFRTTPAGKLKPAERVSPPGHPVFRVIRQELFRSRTTTGWWSE